MTNPRSFCPSNKNIHFSLHRQCNLVRTLLRRHQQNLFLTVLHPFKQFPHHHQHNFVPTLLCRHQHNLLFVSTHPTRTSSYPTFLTSKPRTCSHYIITRTTSMLDSFYFTTATYPNYHLQQTFITNQVLLTVLKNQTTIMNTLNNLPMLLTRGPTTLPTTEMGMGFNSTLGVGDGVGATVGDNLMFAAGVGNSSSIAGCV